MANCEGDKKARKYSGCYFSDQHKTIIILMYLKNQTANKMRYTRIKIEDLEVKKWYYILRPTKIQPEPVKFIQTRTAEINGVETVLYTFDFNPYSMSESNNNEFKPDQLKQLKFFEYPAQRSN